jgi:hypothetical protein
MVTGAEVADVFVFDGTDGIQLEVTPDASTWPRIHAAWDAFARYVAEAQAPPLTDRDTRMRDDPEWLGAAAAYLELRAASEVLSTKLDEAKARLVGLASHAKEQGGGLSVTRFWKKGAVEYRRTPGITKLDLEQFRAAPREEIRITLA